MGEEFSDGTHIEIDPDETGDVMCIIMINSANHISSCWITIDEAKRLIAKIERTIGYVHAAKERYTNSR